MKKILSLILVLCLVFALAPAAYADTDIDISDKLTDTDKPPIEGAISEAYAASLNDLTLQYLRDNYYGSEADGILKDDGHLVSCGGGDCNCLAVLAQADLEYQQQKAADDLKVWIKSSRGGDSDKHDTIVAEINLPCDEKGEEANQDYLDAKEAVNKALQDFCDEHELADELYRPTDFIQNQVLGCMNYVEQERSSQRHLEYRIMDSDSSTLTGLGIDFAEGTSERGKEYVFSCDPIGADMPEHDVVVNVGGLIVKLPDALADKAFTLALRFTHSGAVNVLLADDAGNPVSGAVICSALPEDAGADTVAATMDDKGNLSPIKDSTVEGGCISFTAPTGDDVFALK